VERAVRKDSLAAIGRELGANLLVSGTVQGGDGRLRLTVTLDDTTGGKRIWAQDFAGVTGDLLTIEDQVYQQLVTAMKIEVTGELLRQALEHGVSMVAPGAQPGAFPQVSGIQFSYDASRQPGDRIIQLKVDGQAVSPSRKYSLATTAFVALDGGDGYAMLKNAPVLTSPDRTPLDSDALRRALIGKTIAPKIETRIQRLDKSPATRTECE
jgi:hypothetical protein